MGVCDQLGRHDPARVIALQTQLIQRVPRLASHRHAACPEIAQTSLPSFCRTLPVMPGNNTTKSRSGFTAMSTRPSVRRIGAVTPAGEAHQRGLEAGISQSKFGADTRVEASCGEGT